MKKVLLALLFAVVVGAPIVGGLISHAAEEGPGLDNSTRPAPWHVPVNQAVDAAWDSNASPRPRGANE
jgi:hypothetical protein